MYLFLDKEPRRTRDKFLRLLLINMQDNKIYIDKEIKDEIGKHTVKRLISIFIDEGIMKRIGIARYFINPYMFAKSNEDETNKLRREYANL